MPDLEQRIKDGLDRLEERPDPARVVRQVARRKRHLRLKRQLQTMTLIVVVLAGVGGGMYALNRVFGVGATHPVPLSSNTMPAIALCSDQTAVVTVVSTEGAAGTISTLWRVTNTAQTACRSYGYPGMDFHTASGWLSVPVHRGGFPNINQRPTSIVVPPGMSLYFRSYWGDATTQAGPCQQFDRVRVTQPDNRVSAEVASSGCVNPDSVDVGPVTRTPSS
jgi:hypothetical protein